MCRQLLHSDARKSDRHGDEWVITRSHRKVKLNHRLPLYQIKEVEGRASIELTEYRSQSSRKNRLWRRAGRAHYSQQQNLDHLAPARQD